MINKLGLPLFVIGVLLILISFLRIPQKTNESVRNVVQSSQPPASISIKATASQAKPMVTKIIDGDTVNILVNNQKDTIRIIGINSPETGECFNREATDKAREILNSKSVILEADSSQDNKDKYNRLLRYIFLSNGTNFGEFMIKNGFAKEYTYKVPYKYQSLYKKAEEEAKLGKRGIWADGVCVKAESTSKPQVSSGNQNYSCDCSKLCSQIQTCEEAYYQLNQCGCSKRDSDGDGIPCESICR